MSNIKTYELSKEEIDNINNELGAVNNINEYRQKYASEIYSYVESSKQRNNNYSEENEEKIKG